MKKKKLYLIPLLFIVMLTSIFMGCTIPNNKLVVQFNTNGGSSVSNVEANKNEYINLVAPVKEGYTFEGWYTGQEFYYEFTLHTPVTSNLTLYAKWEVKECTITFNSNDGTLVNYITQNFNTAVNAPIEPTKEGYEFNGWYSDINLSSAYTFITMPAENITLYAKWEIKEYTITFNSNSGTSVYSITQNFNTIVNEPIAPTKEGYEFIGWYSDENLNNAYTFTTMPSENITIFAKWSMPEHTISFNSNGGSVLNSIVQEQGTIVYEPVEPTKEGYEFIGWCSDIDLNKPYIFNTISGQDIVLYAKWCDNAIYATYDPRLLLNKVSPIKNQGSNSSCWAFAATALLEQYCIYTQGTTYDFSEQDMRFQMSNTTSVRAKGEGYYSEYPTGGGNIERASAYLTNCLGPVSGEDVPYTLGNDEDDWANADGSIEPIINVTDIQLIAYDGTGYIDNVKTSILKYGGVLTSIWAGDSGFMGGAVEEYYNSLTSAFYYNGTESLNYDVLIIGWDDAFSKTNFKFGTQPSTDGAWLIKNSQGALSGDDGFLWVSYEDHGITNSDENTFAVIRKAEITNSNEIIMSHDYLGNISPYIFNGYTSLNISNVFEIDDLTYNKITDVVFYVETPSNYEISIVKSLDGKPCTGVVVASGSANTTGYMTVTLDEPYIITSTGSYAIMIKFSGAAGDTYVIGAERDYPYYANAIVNAGESYIYTQNAWRDTLYGIGDGLTDAINFIIRAVLSR